MLYIKIMQINRRGFTLIEIIVVLIILGVLAAIALPSLFGWVERSRAAEATEGIRNISNHIEACMSTGASSDQCMSKIRVLLASVWVANQSLRSPNFNYQLLTDPTAPQEYIIIAYRADAGGLPIHGGTGAANGICGSLNFGSIGGDWLAGFSSCRQAAGNRVLQGFGVYSGLF